MYLPFVCSVRPFLTVREEDHMDHFIGIDIGTSSVKSLIMAEDGRIVGTAQVKYDVMRPLPGYAEQDIDVLWDAEIGRASCRERV